MYRLSSVIYVFLLACQLVWSQSPHGPSLAMDCALCHHPDNWTYDAKRSSFSHDSTSFTLTGRHKDLDCRSCHQSLEFNKAESSCLSCHTDVHQQNLGNDCVRCHNTQSWIVENITQLHENIAFPLIGVHANINCYDCHNSDSHLRFAPVGVTCYDCHRTDYINTTRPNHVAKNFDLDCSSCHDLNNPDWNTDIVDHSFFPLEQGHKINDCAACHLSDDYSVISADCISCHTPDFENTVRPNHLLSGFSTNCVDCHTTAPGWNPVVFNIHDANHFPIYSGKHAGVWNACSECHTDPGNFTTFACINCHTNPETDDGHSGVSGYQYNDNACLACHPTGSADMAFDHNQTGFPLTGAHRMTDCIACHAGGYEGTPTDCFACHALDYNESINPDHQKIGIGTDCKSCHSTEPGWSPAGFDIHDNYYVLNGAHRSIADDCAACHNGDYNNTPTTCYGCHNSDFTEAKDPDHVLNGFSNDCASCHNENLWRPSTFNHDGLYFPIFSGKHNGQWTECIDCHTVIGDLTQFSCITCHTNPETDDVHDEVPGYTYQDNACLACHPTGDADMVFDHNMTAFPLTGAHIDTDCISCHANGYEGTSTVCMDCHTSEYNQTTNPNHLALNISKDCKACHTTNPGWNPATFADHNSYYLLSGAHAVIANDCAACHNGNYNTTPNTCFGCHSSDYNEAKNPDHLALQFPTDCRQCHSESAWDPSTFNHDGMYFPIYSGKHNGVWNDCMECHDSPGNWAVFNCLTCHQNPETDGQHNGVPGYTYNSPACLACHPTGDADIIFDHNTTDFPLTGAHLTADCLECHSSGFQGTPTECVSCHTTDYQASLNPNHSQLNIPTDCIACHTTAPGWSPATFGIHDQYYALTGAHASIANDCVTCHNGDYKNTTNTCVGCHQSDFTAAVNPNHVALGFDNNCTSCHTTAPGWSPAAMPNHDNYYVILGAHIPIANDCAACHNGDYNNTPNTCVGCHLTDFTNTTDPDHELQQFPTDCITCHSQNGWEPSTFDHNSFYPIVGAHVAIANDCNACHNGNYSNTPNTCTGCHLDDYNATVDPDHELQQFPTDCISCHSQNAWEPSTFDHNTVYPIVGAHVAIANDCNACHNGNYSNTPNTCIGCHQDDYNATVDPDHEVGDFPTNCIICHSQNAWTPAFFDHNMVYPLTGAHATIADQCVLCHVGGYNNTPNTCAGCHQEDYNTSLNPNHSTLNFGTDCVSCHTTAPGWSPALMPNHDDYYVIAGAHLAIANDCIACHNGDYNNTPNTCFGCHTADYNAAVDPNHSVNQFPTDCTLCHSQTAWEPSTFDHNNYYPLTGAHASVADDCVACHNGDYNNTPNTCAGCHTQDYNTSINPNHVVLGLSMDCATCHTTIPGWQPATFPVHDNYYVIQGAHTTLTCADCHNGDYNNTPNTCFGCHAADFNTATDPNHSVNQFPTDCTLCHSQTAWTPSTFDHNNYYPLTGAHASIANDCVACHNGDYNNTPNTCAGCHTPDYNATLNPNHPNLGISLDCVSCHTTAPGWQPALFPIHDNYYVLQGAHLSLDCVDCHNGDYNNTPNTCIGCHLDDYQNTTNPDHEVAQFPTDCTACHSQNTWTPSTFNHDDMYFPIYSGRHEGEWNLCSDCHFNPNNYSLFSCIDCHEHDNQAQVDEDHQGVSGYQYNSNACYDCHPTGEN